MQIISAMQWKDVLAGERSAILLTTITVMLMLFRRAFSFMRHRIHFRSERDFGERLVFAVFALSFGSMLYRIQSFIFSPTDSRTLALVQFVAGLAMTVGYYHVILAFRAGYRGKINGFGIRFAGLVIFVTVVGAAISMKFSH